MNWIKANEKLPEEQGSQGFSERVKVKTEEGNEFVSVYDYWEKCWNTSSNVAEWSYLNQN